MKSIALAILLLPMVACESRQAGRPIVDAWGIPSSGISIVKVRGCEYAVAVTGGGYVSGIVHAGDCQNPVHYQQQDTLSP